MFSSDGRKYKIVKRNEKSIMFYLNLFLLGTYIIINGCGTIKPVKNRIVNPYCEDARLSVLWIGHSTILLQMDDKFILTDPFLTDCIGIERRAYEPGIDPGNIPEPDVVLISHCHFDHLSIASLNLIKDKIHYLCLPKSGSKYLSDFNFKIKELEWGECSEYNGLRITALPVKHNGSRFILDGIFTEIHAMSYMIEYHELCVYFGGDSGYDKDLYKKIAELYPKIDLALLPIAPISPRFLFKNSHMDPEEALDAFHDLDANVMVPIHFETFNGFDKSEYAKSLLEKEISRKKLSKEQVNILRIGEQRVIINKSKRY